MLAHHDLLRPERTLSPGEVLHEAERCLQCHDAPCMTACPAGIVIPRFIRMLRSGNVRGAAEVVRSANAMAHSCGIACPDEDLCGAACTRRKLDGPVAIRRLHRYATDHDRPREVRTAAPRQARVAVVGAGPSGLACAYELRRQGIRVVLYEAERRLGGVLSTAIPLYRFPDQTAARDAAHALGLSPAQIKSGGTGRMKIRARTRITDLERLLKSYDAVYVATGLGDALPRLPGADLKGVSGAVAFLQRARRRRYRCPIGSEVVVVGGGNVAIDATMAIVRCHEIAGGRPPRIHLIYRRTRLQMPAWEREIRAAEALGIILHYLVLPAALVGERGRLRGIRLQKAVLGARDASGRPKPRPLPGSEFVLPCDQALLATGLDLSEDLARQLPLTRSGLVKVHAKSGKVRGKLFAGGDATGGEQTIVAAVRDGKRAAHAIVAELAG